LAGGEASPAKRGEPARLLVARMLAAQSSLERSLADAERFLERAEQRLAQVGIKASRAAWVQSNFITSDTQVLAAEAADEATRAITELVGESKQFEGLSLPPRLARKFMLLRLSLTAPAPLDPSLRREMTEISASLEADYGMGKFCRGPDECLDILAVERILETSRDPQELQEVWLGWHGIAPRLRSRYARFVELSNQGARELGFTDTGALWRSGYDMPEEAFRAEVERLWQQVVPLYVRLHTFVRARLCRYYGPGVVPRVGPIPAHLLGNPWAQVWKNIFPILGLAELDRPYDLTELLKAKKLDAKAMVRYGEAFYTSLGFAPLPATFWERSLFTKPADREVVCHASAWDIDNQDDVRVKMCIQVRGADFVTIHHELGHNFYQRAYKSQSSLFQAGANDGFHEAVGDAIALSITPEYLKRIGLLEKLPAPELDIPILLKQALDKVAFLPFGLLVDQWRWKVFAGEIRPENYNRSWWEMRRNYQGVAPPSEPSESHFDPGAKYHVAANVPYMRYFLAALLEFQFYRALCRESGYQGRRDCGPLHRSSFYGSKQAGRKLNQMLELGASEPWPDALEKLTGSRQLDAGALLEYFEPLSQWLDEQNRGESPGW
jgi:peptidyl-dipeptidase A